MSKLVLGLDLGPNSIGWALVNDDPENPDDCNLVDLGVRVFPEGVDAFDTSKEKSRNEDRRIARGMRRQTLRRARRRRHLKEALIQAGLWPAGSAAQAELYQLDPYSLRARALNEELSPHEIGRILLHLNQRRGFLSNRKKDRGDSEVKGMLAEINTNEQERAEGGFDTIGAWLADKLEQQDHTNRAENDHIRSRHLARNQYEDEFEAIWTAQSAYHPDALTDQLKYGSQGKHSYPTKPRRRESKESLLEAFGLHGLLFFQRPMYWPKSVVGLCELEPKQKRCPRSDRRYQRFRMLQEVNNLRYVDPDTHTEHKLSDRQRQLLLEKLNRTKEMTFDRIRKALGFLESVKFNLERGKRSKIQGVPIDALLANKNVLGSKWYDRPEDEKTQIVAILLDTEHDEDQFIERAVNQWGMTTEQAEAALEVDLKPGYGNLSLMALEKLLPHMERGLLYMAEDESNSALHAAGYLRRDQLQRRIFDKLPDPARTRDCPIGDIPNPVVKRTLTEVRRVVNAIIREYGKPDEVHIEMTREVQLGKTKRDERSKQMREREAEREMAATELRKYSVHVTHDNILKYMLWKQQGKECIYSGEPIIMEKLFGEGGGVEVDHILPRSRTLDDSQMNKVVCLRTSNAEKGDQTPYEWLADIKPDQYAQVCQRASKLMKLGKMPYPKYRRFIQKELDTGKFIARQLTDTGYITRATAEYLRCLFEHNHDVLGLKGQHTSTLRHHWGLGTVLKQLLDSPGWQDEKAGKLRPGEKNRADHRHHAIDAVVIALTNRSRLQRLAEGFADVEFLNKETREREYKSVYRGKLIEPPWPHFRDDVKSRIAEVNVSHRVERKVRGALHEDTLYGPTGVEGEWVVRKPLVDLSASEIEHIRDSSKRRNKQGIRQIVLEELKSKGIEIRTITPKRGKPKTFFADQLTNKEVPVGDVKAVLCNISMPSGVPIKKVRIIKPELTIRPVRQGRPGEAYVKPGSTHHLCIFQWEEGGKTKRDAVFVTMLEATERLKRQQKELAPIRKELAEQGLTGKKLKQALAKHASRIAKQFPLIQRDARNLEGKARERIPEEAEFVMSLSGREMVLADWKGEEKLLTFKTAASTQGQIYFAEHTDARKSSDYEKHVAKANTLHARKVTVDPLGRIRWAND